jgi:hypothetical protein
MVDQVHQGPCSCANGARDMISHASRQRVAMRAGFMVPSVCVFEAALHPRIYVIKKFLIIAESSCGSTWQ